MSAVSLLLSLPRGPELNCWQCDGETEEPVKRKRGRKPSENSEEKRKVQNRAAQRAFRERKEAHLREIEDKVLRQQEQILRQKELIERLMEENRLLREGKDVPETPVDLSVLQPVVELSKSPSVGLLSESGTIPDAIEEEEMDELLVNDGDTASAAQSAHGSPPPAEVHVDASDSSMATEPSSASSALPKSNDTNDVDDPSNETSDAFDDFKLENFNVPLDTSTFAHDLLPGVFQELFDPDLRIEPGRRFSLPRLRSNTITQLNSGSNATSGGGDVDMMIIGPPDDGSTPAELTDGEMPCLDCDFDTMSCTLPMPWRPPAIGDHVKPDETWTCRQAWAKLVSHPLFRHCDVDELCYELKDRARCSTDGRLVVSRSAVGDIFGSLPERARAFAAKQGMSAEI